MPCRPPVSETLQAKKRYREQQRGRAQQRPPSNARGPPPPSLAALGELAAQQGSARRAASGQEPGGTPPQQEPQPPPPEAAPAEPEAPEHNWCGQAGAAWYGLQPWLLLSHAATAHGMSPPWAGQSSSCAAE